MQKASTQFHGFTPYWLLLTLLLILFLGSGCASSNKKEQITVRFQAVGNLNPDINNVPSPLVVKLYQLKNDVVLKKATFDAIYDRAQVLFGSDLLDESEIMLRPGEHLTKEVVLWPDTAFIVFIADYQNIDHSKWLAVLNISKKTTGKDIDVLLGSQIVTAQFMS